METQRYETVTDLKKLTSFKNKKLRDSYISGRVRTSIALQIRELREKQELTQTDFAKKIGKPQSVVSRLEDTEYGRVTLKTLLDIAGTLNISVVVKFVSFDEFLRQHGDISPAALAVETFDETVFRLKNEEVQPTRLDVSGTQITVASTDPDATIYFGRASLAVDPWAVGGVGLEVPGLAEEGLAERLATDRDPSAAIVVPVDRARL